MPGVSVTVSRDIDIPRDALFDWFIPVDLPDLFLGFGPLPPVVRTEGQTGPWNRPGSSRTVHLADGNTAHERVTEHDRPRYFAYTVSDPTNALRFLVREATGRWWFGDKGGVTGVRWTYTFHAHSPVAAAALYPVAKLFWRGYMRVAITAMKRLAEAERVDPQAARVESARS